MKRIESENVLTGLPSAAARFIGAAQLSDRSGCSGMKTFFIDKDDGYFLKIGAKNSLSEEKTMTEYFASIGLHAGVAFYESGENDFLVTRRVIGETGIDPLCLEKPERLADGLAEALRRLHDLPAEDCPIQGRTERFASKMRANTEKRVYDDEPNNLDFLKKLGFCDNVAAYEYFMAHASDLRDNALIHGDSCLPNAIFRNFRPCGFIDLGLAGVGDRNYDLFWTAWSLFFNLKTRKYENRFFDAYGREKSTSTQCAFGQLRARFSIEREPEFLSARS